VEPASGHTHRFALAARDAGVDFLKARGASITHHGRDDPFTAFDVWCAGLSPATFKDIDVDLASYQKLL